jgi:hypothetical protein
VSISCHTSQWDAIPKGTVSVIYQFETWLITFREEYSLRMFKIRMLRKISVAEREFQEIERTAY